MQPQRLLGKHGKLFVRDAVEMNTREVVADIDQPLTNPLVVTYCPGVYQFTSRL
ncbi:hypothetical protein [uncultured Parabacteroides sp.]|uniref:hypothetical protein n=1 Tax=uncultured Parabacteroides sp. TaxID=512312 RepID=UPI00259A2D29|nr:hypothetical protein [uncultured Parabacteroides sp.]